jgi:hypothetical protein
MITDVVVWSDKVDATLTTPAVEQIVTVTVTNPDGHTYTGLIDVRRRTGEFHPMTPTRLLDTRIADPMHPGVGRLAANHPLSVLISGGLNGPLMGLGVGSLVVNVTVVDPAAAGFLTAWPAGSALPDASSINYAAGRTVANLVTVAIGPSPVSPGFVGPSPFMAFLLVASTTTDVVMDVVGWYRRQRRRSPTPLLSPAASSRSPRAAHRHSVPDDHPRQRSRFAANGPLHANETRTLSLDSAAASSTESTPSPSMSRCPARPPRLPHDLARRSVEAGRVKHQPRPAAIPNMVIVPISALHQLNFYNSAGDTDVIVDLVGVYETGFYGGLLFASTTPTRVLDSRLGKVLPARPLNAGETVMVSVGSGPAPVALVMNTVLVGSTTPTGYVTVYPADVPRPDVSNLNVQVGERRQSGDRPLSADGANAIAIFNANGPVDLIADLTGFFY